MQHPSQVFDGNSGGRCFFGGFEDLAWFLFSEFIGLCLLMFLCCIPASGIFSSRIFLYCEVSASFRCRLIISDLISRSLPTGIDGDNWSMQFGGISVPKILGWLRISGKSNYQGHGSGVDFHRLFGRFSADQHSFEIFPVTHSA